MAKLFNNEKAMKIKEIVYERADKYDYINRGRVDNGIFMTTLVEDPDVGGVLSEYLDRDKIRTYIKDGILNAYTKSRKKEILKGNSPIDTIKKIYTTAVTIIQAAGDITVCRSNDGKLFVVSNGTFSKWETALRKALELIAREPKLIINGKTPEICLQIVVLNLGITDGDKSLITDALGAIGVKAIFCGRQLGI